jgi:hypothetical protein
VDPIATTGCIAAVKIASGSSTLDLHREWGSPLLHATLTSDGVSAVSHYPAGNTALENLLAEELISGPRHRIYLKSLTALESLLRS